MASRMSKPLLFSKAPPSGILFDHAKRLGTGGIRVEMQYDTSQAPEMELGATKQKVLIQSARLRRATPVYSDKFKKVCAIHRRSHTHTHRCVHSVRCGPQWSCLCSMGGWQDELTEIHGFYTWVKDMDQHAIDTCKDRCQEWFKKSLTPAQVEGEEVQASFCGNTLCEGGHAPLPLPPNKSRDAAARRLLHQRHEVQPGRALPTEPARQPALQERDPGGEQSLGAGLSVMEGTSGHASSSTYPSSTLMSEKWPPGCSMNIISA